MARQSFEALEMIILSRNLAAPDLYLEVVAT